VYFADYSYWRITFRVTPQCWYASRGAFGDIPELLA